MSYYFSPSKNIFYFGDSKDSYVKTGMWADDSEIVDDGVAKEFTALPPAGKIRGVVDGAPAWVDIQPPTHEELIAIAEQMVKMLLAEATTIIAPLADAQAGDYIDDADVPRLAEWQRYRYQLTKVNTSTAPDLTLPPRPGV